VKEVVELCKRDPAKGYQQILRMGKEADSWGRLNFVCYSPSCSSSDCYSTLCRKRFESRQRYTELKNVLVQIKLHKDMVKRKKLEFEEQQRILAKELRSPSLANYDNDRSREKMPFAVISPNF
jgi:hypothetical protein